MVVKLVASHIPATYSATEMCISHQTRLYKNFFHSMIRPKSRSCALQVARSIFSSFPVCASQQVSIRVEDLRLQVNWKGRD